MNRIRIVVLGCFVCAGFVACSQQDYPGPPRIPLSGKISLDGEPVDVGSISFLPLEPEQRVSGGYIADGRYEVPEAQGANAGKYRIEIRWQKKTGRMIREMSSEEPIDERKEGMPAKFNTDSELTVDVTPDKTEYDFELQSKK